MGKPLPLRVALQNVGAGTEIEAVRPEARTARPKTTVRRPAVPSTRARSRSSVVLPDDGAPASSRPPRREIPFCRRRSAQPCISRGMRSERLVTSRTVFSTPFFSTAVPPMPTRRLRPAEIKPLWISSIWLYTEYPHRRRKISSMSAGVTCVQSAEACAETVPSFFKNRMRARQQSMTGLCTLSRTSNTSSRMRCGNPPEQRRKAPEKGHRLFKVHTQRSTVPYGSFYGRAPRFRTKSAGQGDRPVRHFYPVLDFNFIRRPDRAQSASSATRNFSKCTGVSACSENDACSGSCTCGTAVIAVPFR